MNRSDARCATPYIYSGELRIRPEVDAALAALKDKPYTAIPSWKNDGTWELWTVEVMMKPGPASSAAHRQLSQ